MHPISVRLAICWGAAFVGMFAAGCAPRPPKAPGADMTSMRYEVTVASRAPWVVDVSATFDGGVGRVIVEHPEGLLAIDVDGKALAPKRGAWSLGCRATCRVHYRFDLDALASVEDSLDDALHTGDDVIAPAYAWLVRPDPSPVNVPVRIRVRTPEGVKFASGLRRAADDSGDFELASQELIAAGYTAFGTFATREVKAQGGVVDVAILGGERDVSDDQIARWVGVEAATLNHVYGKFPVARAQLFVAPQRNNDEVDFGRTLPSGGSSILVLIGAHADEHALYGDWILAHELFHLGVPSFFHEGKWLDEGLATYYEPVVRTRAGLRSSSSLWTEFTRDMRRGLPARDDHGLTAAEHGSRIYWGGAMFVMQADLLIRERTHGAKSLDDGLRAVLASGGDATRIWTVDSFLKTIDRAVGVPVMAELYERASRAGGACPELAEEMLTARCLPQAEGDLGGLFRALGVSADGAGGVVLHDDAPLASLRRQIASPTRR